MKHLVSSLFIVWFGVLGCQTHSTPLVNPLVEECVGVSDYFINNQSRYDVVVEIAYAKEVGSKTDSSRLIPSKQTLNVAQDASFGSIPKPANTFTKLALYRSINGQSVLVYTQNPVLNERWIKTKRNINDPDYGCYQVTNTLVITDADVQYP